MAASCQAVGAALRLRTPEHLGERLSLPPRFEPLREQAERQLTQWRTRARRPPAPPLAELRRRDER